MLITRIPNYPDRLGPSGNFVENSTKLTCLEITENRVKYSTVLWLSKLQIRRAQNVQTQVPAVNTRVGTLIGATIYLQLIQNNYMFRSVTVLQCSHQHCVQPVASNVEVVGYF